MHAASYADYWCSKGRVEKAKHVKSLNWYFQPNIRQYPREPPYLPSQDRCGLKCSYRFDLLPLVLNLVVIRKRRWPMRLNVCRFARRDMVRKRWNTVRWKELFGSPGRMPHLAREQRLATLDRHCLGFGDPNEGKYSSQETKRGEEKECPVCAHVRGNHIREDQREDKTEEPLQGSSKGTGDWPKSGWKDLCGYYPW